MRTYGMTNAAWGHNWMMDILFWDQPWETAEDNYLHNSGQLPPPVFSHEWEALVFHPEGAIDYFTSNSTVAQLTQPPSQITLQPASSVGYPVTSNPQSADTNGYYWGDPG